MELRQGRELGEGDLPPASSKPRARLPLGRSDARECLLGARLARTNNLYKRPCPNRRNRGSTVEGPLTLWVATFICSRVRHQGWLCSGSCRIDAGRIFLQG